MSAHLCPLFRSAAITAHATDDDAEGRCANISVDRNATVQSDPASRCPWYTPTSGLLYDLSWAAGHLVWGLPSTSGWVEHLELTVCILMLGVSPFRAVPAFHP